MKKIITDIQKALEADAPMSAFALALTVPDVCAQVEYPNIIGVGERYKKWFNSHLDKYYKGNFTFSGTSSFGIQEFNSDICYKLRCKFLHSSNAETDLSILSEMYFWVPVKGAQYDDCDTGIVKRMPDGSRHTTIILNIPQFCKNVCCAAQEFYDTWPQKSDFDKHEIRIEYGEIPHP